jgi:predicted transcriptional regulator
MAQLEVPEKYAAELNELAQRDDKSVQEVVSEAMEAYLSFRFTEAKLTPAQLDRLQSSLAQAERGELLSDVQVEAFFDDWDKEAASR